MTHKAYRTPGFGALLLTFIFILSCGFNETVRSQEPKFTVPLKATKSEREAAKKHLRNLREGALVVIMKSNQKKLDTLRSHRSRATEGSSLYRKYDEKIKELSLKSAFRQHEIVKSAKENYTFSDLYFTYDYKIPSLRANKRSGYFLNEDLEFDPDFRIPETDSIYTLKHGVTDEIENYGTSAWLLRTRNLDRIEDPFPNYVKAKGAFFDGLLKFLTIYNDEEKFSKNIDGLFSDLNLVLYREYSQL